MGIKVKNIRMTGTRNSIMQAFFELVNEKDFEKITIQNVTERAQINRATFYAHFQDKYELLDEIIGDSAVELIEKHTQGNYAFNKEQIEQLVYAVFEYLHQVKDKCQRSYETIIPLLRTQMLDALTKHLEECLRDIYTEEERSFNASLYARIIFEAGYLWGMEKTNLSQQNIAEKVTNLIFK
ncbi:TetR/AcrR family transcriptional regulator [Neobacillus vireti]|uniref:TetR/AcrR family transcriptional regulator n=1 Tax=Neobacillus vireti TaxID=220686 RepID=UPI002FFD9711